MPSKDRKIWRPSCCTRCTRPSSSISCCRQQPCSSSSNSSSTAPICRVWPPYTRSDVVCLVSHFNTSYRVCACVCVTSVPYFSGLHVSEAVGIIVVQQRVDPSTFRCFCKYLLYSTQPTRGRILESHHPLCLVQISLPASPVTAQLVGRTQSSISSGVSTSISQQAMLLGGRPTNCNQAHMYLRTQMVSDFLNISSRLLCQCF